MNNDNKKIIVIHTDTAKCVGHARCAAVAPTVYELNDDGFNDQPLRIVDLDQQGAATRGAGSCPERVIKIEVRDEQATEPNVPQ